jgi:hypothetical protein
VNDNDCPPKHQDPNSRQSGPFLRCIGAERGVRSEVGRIQIWTDTIEQNPDGRNRGEEHPDGSGFSTPLHPGFRLVRDAVSDETGFASFPLHCTLYGHSALAPCAGIRYRHPSRCGCPLRVRTGCVNRRVAHPRATLPRGARSRLHSETGPTWLCRSRPGAPSMSSVSVLPIRPGPRFALVFLLLKPEAVLYGHD